MVDVLRTSSSSGNKLYSTGVEDLDGLLGGGICRQRIYLIKKDRNANCGRILFDLFLAQGLIDENVGVYVLSLDNGWKDIVKNSCYTSTDTESEYESNTQPSPAQGDSFKIAWRYAGMNGRGQKRNKSKFNFDLSLKPSKDFLDRCYGRVSGFDRSCLRNLSNVETQYACILSSIQNELGEIHAATNCSQLRICIDNLGSFLWPGWDEYVSSGKFTHIIYFLWGLQSILNTYPFACVCVSVPAHYYPPSLLSTIVLHSSVSLSIESFVDNRHAHFSQYSNIYDGFLTIERGRKCGWEALGYKVCKKGIIIKTLSIPPDESIEASRIGGTQQEVLKATQDLF